ncbi:MAG: 50S ribosomal protein L32 [candidate division WOR-3 bacterium]|nr:MAG: 50S ribosomal protein L32 [candidate division WOR-3 bacterium]
MAVPKRRHSRSRRDKRRSQKKVRPRSYVECPKCHSPKLPHRICPNCGNYNNKLVVPPKEEKEKG